MDTSETYIKMCEKAEEIQTDDRRYDGNNQFNPDPYKTGLVIWLPRQDQLQEMIGDYKRCSQFLAEYFNSMINWEPFREETREDYWDAGLHGKFTSMEQLWLAFVMKEKYGKVWEGEEWLG